MRKNKFVKGFIDPLSLVAIAFLILTVGVGTAITTNTNVSMNINKFARSIIDIEQKEEKGGYFCSSDKLDKTKSTYCECGCSPNTSGGRCNTCTSTSDDFLIPTLGSTIKPIIIKPTPTPKIDCFGTCNGSAQGSISCNGIDKPIKCECDSNKNLGYPTWVKQEDCSLNQVCVMGKGCISGNTCMGTCNGSVQGSISCNGIDKPIKCECDSNKNLDYPTWISQPTCMANQSCVVGRGCLDASIIKTTPTPTTATKSSEEYCNASLIKTSGCGEGGCLPTQVQQTWKNVNCETTTKCVDNSDCKANPVTSSYCSSEKLKTSVCKYGCTPTVSGGTCKEGLTDVKTAPTPTKSPTPTPTPRPITYCSPEKLDSTKSTFCRYGCTPDTFGGTCNAQTFSFTKNSPTPTPTTDTSLIPNSEPTTETIKIAPSVQDFYDQKDLEWQDYKIPITYIDDKGNIRQVERTMKQIGCGPTTVANILEEGGMQATPTQIAQQIPDSDWGYGGTRYTANIAILESYGYKADLYTKSLYNLTKYMKPDEELWISANVGNIQHHTYINGYTIVDGTPIYNMVDPYFGSDLKCIVTNNQEFGCKDSEGKTLIYDTNNFATIILTPPQPNN